MLTIAISTIGERIKFINEYIFHPRVNYLIIWQKYEDVLIESDLLSELPNVKVVKITSIGVANSRNVAVSHCTTHWLWFMDDDVTMSHGSIVRSLELIASAHENEVFIASVKSPDGSYIKKYTVAHSNKIRSILNVGTIQIIVNVNLVKRCGARFPVNMGAGSENHLCDEPVFLYRLLKSENSVRFVFPLGFCVTHPLERSGATYLNAGSVRSRAMLFREIYGFPFCILASIYFLFKHHREIGRFWLSIFFYAQAK